MLNEFGFVFLFLQALTNFLSHATGQIVIYLKGYYRKVCMKVTLERGASVGKWLGDFHQFENEMLMNITVTNADVDEVQFEFNKCKAELVQREICRLKIETENLWKTITNKKREVQLKIDEISFLQWKSYIDEREKDFKIMYSREANMLYDHYYEMDRVTHETFSKITSCTIDVVRNVCAPFHENRLVQLMENEFSSEMRDDLMNDFVRVPLNLSGISNSDGSKSTDEDQIPIDDSGFASLVDEVEMRKLNDVSEGSIIAVVDEVGIVDATMSEIEKLIHGDCE